MAKRKTLTKDFEEIVKAGDMDAFKKFFDKCDINAYGGYYKSNAFYFALSDEMIQWLLEQGADINYVDAYGYTPLFHHAWHSYSEQQAMAQAFLTYVQIGEPLPEAELAEVTAIVRAIRSAYEKEIQTPIHLSQPFSTKLYILVNFVLSSLLFTIPILYTGLEC